MTALQIKDLPVAGSIDGTELAEIQLAAGGAGSSKQTTLADIAATAFLSLVNAADDAAAATAGVAVGKIYRNGSVLQIRVS